MAEYETEINIENTLILIQKRFPLKCSCKGGLQGRECSLYIAELIMHAWHLQAIYENAKFSHF